MELTEQQQEPVPIPSHLTSRGLHVFLAYFYESVFIPSILGLSVLENLQTAHGRRLGREALLNTFFWPIHEASDVSRTASLGSSLACWLSRPA